MLQMLGAVAPLAKILFSTIEKSVPDKDLQAKLKADLQTQLLQSLLKPQRELCHCNHPRSVRWLAHTAPQNLPESNLGDCEPVGQDRLGRWRPPRCRRRPR